jgi:hypothetical protein
MSVNSSDSSMDEGNSRFADGGPNTRQQNAAVISSSESSNGSSMDTEEREEVANPTSALTVVRHTLSAIRMIMFPTAMEMVARHQDSQQQFEETVRQRREKYVARRLDTPAQRQAKLEASFRRNQVVMVSCYGEKDLCVFLQKMTQTFSVLDGSNKRLAITQSVTRAATRSAVV